MEHLLLDQSYNVCNMCAHRSMYVYLETEKDITQLCVHTIINNFTFNYSVVYCLWKYDNLVILYESCFNTEVVPFETLIKEQSKVLG